MPTRTCSAQLGSRSEKDTFQQWLVVSWHRMAANAIVLSMLKLAGFLLHAMELRDQSSSELGHTQLIIHVPKGLPLMTAAGHSSGAARLRKTSIINKRSDCHARLRIGRRSTAQRRRCQELLCRRTRQVCWPVSVSSPSQSGNPELQSAPEPSRRKASLPTQAHANASLALSSLRSFCLLVRAAVVLHHSSPCLLLRVCCVQN